MNFYYDRNDFMVGHVLLNIINIIKVTLAKGVWKKKKKKNLLLILTCSGEHPNFLWSPWII